MSWKKKAAVDVLILALLAGSYFTFIVRTPYGHRAVIWPDNAIEERQPGFSFVLRPIQSVYFVDVREQRYVTVDAEGKANAFVQSSDLQEITVRASLVYAIFPDQAAEIYDKVGLEYEKRIIEPIFFDAVKEAGGQRVALAFAEELSAIADDIETIVTPQLTQRGIQVLSVALEDAVFDPLFITSVKEKVIADQEAEEQRKLVEAERARAQQVELQAGAERARATALGLSPAEYLEWLYLQKWDGALPKTLLGDAASVILSGVE